MSTVRVDCSEAFHSVQCPDSRVFSTPLGLCILEIQGELNLPDHAPPEVPDNDTFLTIDDVYTAVKFGMLEFDEKDPSKVVLYVGKSQRLLGNLVKLEKPLGVLRVPLDGHEGSVEPIKMVDIVRNKLLFKERPLPIM